MIATEHRQPDSHVIKALRAENVTLRHRIDSLLAQVENREVALPCRLTPSQEIIARLLFSQSPRIVSREAIFNALYCFRSEEDEPDMVCVDVTLSYTRRRLAAVGITFDNHWGKGWSMPKKSADRWRSLAALQETGG